MTRRRLPKPKLVASKAWWVLRRLQVGGNGLRIGGVDCYGSFASMHLLLHLSGYGGEACSCLAKIHAGSRAGSLSCIRS